MAKAGRPTRAGPTDPDAGKSWLESGPGKRALAKELDDAELRKEAARLFHDLEPQEQLPRLKGWLDAQRNTAKRAAKGGGPRRSECTFVICTRTRTRTAADHRGQRNVSEGPISTFSPSF